MFNQDHSEKPAAPFELHHMGHRNPLFFPSIRIGMFAKMEK